MYKYILLILFGFGQINAFASYLLIPMDDSQNNHLKAYGEPDYVSGVVEGPAEDSEASIDAVLGLGGNTDGEDALYDTAVQVVIKDRKCSTSYIQRKLAIGYNKAAKLVEQMEDEGVVSSANHVGKREILVPEQH